MLKHLVKQVVPRTLYRPILDFWLQNSWGYPRRIDPLNRTFGFSRGQPVDRYYIEAFLQRYQDDIRGHVLEVAYPEYTRKLGGERVFHSDVLHVVPGNRHATLVGDLATGQGIPQATFDCMILTQVLLCIYDLPAAIANCYAALAPGGVALVTLPGISQISRYDMNHWGDYWRFTDASARRLFSDVFSPENVTVETYGNALVACAFLSGRASQELKRKELDYHDPDYQVSIAVRAVKPQSSPL